MNGRRAAELEQSTRAAVAALAGDVLRLSTVLRLGGAGEDGRPVVVLDWLGDGTLGVEAVSNADVAFAVGNVVLVVMVGRTPFVVCKAGGFPSDDPSV